MSSKSTRIWTSLMMASLCVLLHSTLVSSDDVKNDTCSPTTKVSANEEGEEASIECEINGIAERGGVVILNPNSYEQIASVIWIFGSDNTSNVNNSNPNPGLRMIANGIGFSEWKLFGPDISDLSITFGLRKPQATCVDQIFAYCWCDDSVKNHGYWPLHVKVISKTRAALPITTPLKSSWSEGVPQGAWVGARCLAFTDISSWYTNLRWVIHRGDKKEILKDNSSAIIFKTRARSLFYFGVNNDPVTIHTRMCEAMTWTSSINFVASSNDQPLSLECQVYIDDDNARVLASTQTERLNIISPVSKENTKIELVNKFENIYKCHSQAYPHPTYTWWKKGNSVKLNSSAGPEPAYLKSELSPNQIICKVTNMVDTTRYTQSVYYIPNKGVKKPQISNIAQGQTKDKYDQDTLTFPIAVVAAIAVAGLIGVVLLVTQEDTVLMATQQAWIEMDEKRASLFLERLDEHEAKMDTDSFSPRSSFAPRSSIY